MPHLPKDHMYKNHDPLHITMGWLPTPGPEEKTLRDKTTAAGQVPAQYKPSTKKTLKKGFSYKTKAIANSAPPKKIAPPTAGPTRTASPDTGLAPALADPDPVAAVAVAVAVAFELEFARPVPDDAAVLVVIPVAMIVPVGVGVGVSMGVAVVDDAAVPVPVAVADAEAHWPSPAVCATTRSEASQAERRQLTAWVPMADCEAHAQAVSDAGVQTAEMAVRRQGVCWPYSRKDGVVSLQIYIYS